MSETSFESFTSCSDIDIALLELSLDFPYIE